MGIQLRLGSSTELSYHKVQVGWGQGSLGAAPQAGWKFREVFLMTHGSHFFNSALTVNRSSVCPWPQLPCGHPSRLSYHQNLTKTHISSLSLPLLSLSLSFADTSYLRTKKRYCQFLINHTIKFTFSIWWKRPTQQVKLKPKQNTGGILTWKSASQPTTTLHETELMGEISLISLQVSCIEKETSALMDTQFRETLTLVPLNIHPPDTSMGAIGRMQHITLSFFATRWTVLGADSIYYTVFLLKVSILNLIMR